MLFTTISVFLKFDRILFVILHFVLQICLHPVQWKKKKQSVNPDMYSLMSLSTHGVYFLKSFGGHTYTHVLFWGH